MSDKKKPIGISMENPLRFKKESEETLHGQEAGQPTPAVTRHIRAWHRRKLWARIRLLISIVLLAALVMVVWALVPRFLAERKRQQALEEAEITYQPNHPQSGLTRYQNLEQQDPNERAVLLGLAKSYSDLPDRDRALEYAARIANWEPVSEDNPSWQDRLYRRVRNWIQPEAAPVAIERAEAYTYLAQALPAEPADAFMQELGNRLVALNENDPWGNLCLMRVALAARDDDRVLELVERGLEPGSPETAGEFWAARAEVYVVRRRWADAVEACQQALNADRRLTPRVLPLKRMADIGLRDGLE